MHIIHQSIFSTSYDLKSLKIMCKQSRKYISFHILGDKNVMNNNIYLNHMKENRITQGKGKHLTYPFLNYVSMHIYINFNTTVN